MPVVAERQERNPFPPHVDWQRPLRTLRLSCASRHRCYYVDKGFTLMSSFETLGLCPELIAAVENEGWLLPRSVQDESIPLILGGSDVVIAAETGSGKTGAMALPILQLIHESFMGHAAASGLIQPEPEDNVSAFFSQSVSDKDVTVEVGGTELSTIATSFVEARAITSVSSGKWAWECTILSGGSTVRVGMSRADKNVLLGRDYYSFGLGSAGVASHNGSFVPVCTPFGTGDIITVLFDADKKGIQFALNGELISTPYTDGPATADAAAESKGKSGDKEGKKSQAPDAWRPHLCLRGSNPKAPAPADSAAAGTPGLASVRLNFNGPFKFDAKGAGYTPLSLAPPPAAARSPASAPAPAAAPAPAPAPVADVPVVATAPGAPVPEYLNSPAWHALAVVAAPTRELAIQLHNELLKFAHLLRPRVTVGLLLPPGAGREGVMPCEGIRDPKEANVVVGTVAAIAKAFGKAQKTHADQQARLAQKEQEHQAHAKQEQAKGNGKGTGTEGGNGEAKGKGKGKSDAKSAKDKSRETAILEGNLYPLGSRTKFLVLDEVDQIYTDSLSSLKSLLEVLPSQPKQQGKSVSPGSKQVQQAQRPQRILASATLHSDAARAAVSLLCSAPLVIDLRGQVALPSTVDHALIRVDPGFDDSWVPRDWSGGSPAAAAALVAAAAAASAGGRGGADGKWKRGRGVRAGNKGRKPAAPPQQQQQQQQQQQAAKGQQQDARKGLFDGVVGEDMGDTDTFAEDEVSSDPARKEACLPFLPPAAMHPALPRAAGTSSARISLAQAYALTDGVPSTFGLTGASLADPAADSAAAAAAAAATESNKKVSISQLNSRASADDYASFGVKLLKLQALLYVISSLAPSSAMIFARTRADCESISTLLCRCGYTAAPFHSSAAADRAQTILDFKQHKIRFLVCTDVAARGIDVKGLPMVINMTLPDDAPTYAHRVGRTGRAGTQGLALSIVSTAARERVWWLSSARGVSLEAAMAEANKAEAAGHPRGSALAEPVDQNTVWLDEHVLLDQIQLMLGAQVPTVTVADIAKGPEHVAKTAGAARAFLNAAAAATAAAAAAAAAAAVAASTAQARALQGLETEVQIRRAALRVQAGAWGRALAQAREEAQAKRRRGNDNGAPVTAE